jgi:hypothetical protein
MRIFNRYFSLYDLIMVLGDVIVAFFATVAVRATISFLEISSGPEWIFWSFQAVAVTLIVVISLLAGVEGYHDALGRELVNLHARGGAMEDSPSFYERLAQDCDCRSFSGVDRPM